MGASASFTEKKINLEAFKTISGENFHQEVFDAYKDDNQEIDKGKMSELIAFAERLSRLDEVFLFFVKREMLLDKSELSDLMALLGHNLSDKDISNLESDKKSVSLPQFVKLMNEKIAAIDVLVYEAFRIFDTDQSGYISPEELKAALLQISNGSMSLEEIANLTNTADVDKDGQINIEEFVKSIYPKVAEKLKETDKVIFETFQMLDSRKTGLLTPAEFKQFVLQVSNGQIDVTEIEKLIEAADTDGDGMINLDEFKIKLFPKIEKQLKRIENAAMEAFRVFDIDKNGLISPEEFKPIMTTILKGELTPDQIDALLVQADTDKDGQINIDEFKKQIYPLVAAKMKKIDEVITSTFRKFDHDKSGLVTPDEIARVFKEMSNNELDLDEVFKAIDLNGDGQIDLAEFKKSYYENKVKLF